jgi:hypothetical protein
MAFAAKLASTFYSHNLLVPTRKVCEFEGMLRYPNLRFPSSFTLYSDWYIDGTSGKITVRLLKTDSALLLA